MGRLKRCRKKVGCGLGEICCAKARRGKGLAMHEPGSGHRGADTLTVRIIPAMGGCWPWGVFVGNDDGDDGARIYLNLAGQSMQPPVVSE